MGCDGLWGVWACRCGKLRDECDEEDGLAGGTVVNVGESSSSMPAVPL